eukprot:TRINITY_DN6860_c0_g1_i1.p1 TRINITY_DN6860_c0_g1~~TRINITY_DN6860_c0_g1_i1.p1  ORF type:complete len:333 (-),score=31.37 TRINITY_DN6860_c0_g1_i1:45-1043(-)
MNETTLNCSISGTIKNNGNDCICFPGWAGDICDNQVTWWSSAVLALRIYGTILLSFCLYWSALKYAHLVSSKRVDVNLALFSNISTTIACILRVVWIWIPDKITMGDPVEQYPTSVSWVISLLFLFPYVLWLGSTSLMMAFWADLVSASIKRESVYKKLKPFIIGALAILFVAEVICTLAAFINYYDLAVTIGSIILLLYIIGLGILLAVSIRGADIVNFEEKTKRRIKKLTFNLKINLLFYGLFTLSVVYFYISVIRVQNAISTIIVYFLHRSFEFSFAFSVLNMLDKGRLGIYTLMLWAFCGEKLSTPSTNNTQQSGQAAENTDERNSAQ